jgi:S1-C subfamily serine protease
MRSTTGSVAAALVACTMLGTVAATARADVDLASLCVAVRPAYVFIAGGSGVVIRPDGLMLTNDHVLENRRTFDVRLGDGRSFKARLLGRDEVGDLAVLKIDVPEGESLPHLPLGDSDAVRVGDEVVAVGFPYGIGPSVSAGVVSGLNREFLSPKGKRVLTRLIQFDAAANPGNSGGPLVTMEGEVVGIVTAILSPNGAGTFIGIGFATTIEAAGGAVGIPPF